MQVVTKEVSIPASVCTETKYVAHDGEEFWTEKECLDYE